MRQSDEDFAREAAGIWSKLSQTDVSRHVEKKNGLSYLSWAWAWGVLMENYPGATFWWDKNDKNEELIELRDGTGEVRCNVCINGVTRTMWLPVMDHKNKAIVDPDAMAVNKAKMRCLVKCLALFGLGFSIYAGEDLTDDEPKDREPRAARPKPGERKPAASRPAASRPSSVTPASPVEQAEDAIAKLAECQDMASLKAAFTRSHLFLVNNGLTEHANRLVAAKEQRKAQLESAA